MVEVSTTSFELRDEMAVQRTISVSAEQLVPWDPFRWFTMFWIVGGQCMQRGGRVTRQFGPLGNRNSRQPI